MSIVIVNPNYTEPRDNAIQAAAAAVSIWMAEPTQINTESFSGGDIIAGVPSVAALLPLTDGEIHSLAEYAGCQVII